MPQLSLSSCLITICQWNNELNITFNTVCFTQGMLS